MLRPKQYFQPHFLSSLSKRPPIGPTEGEPELRDTTPVVSGISGGASMVATAPLHVEWSNFADTSSTADDSIRCLPDRVGDSVRGGSNLWYLVSRGAEDAHQLFRVDSSISSSPGLCQGSFGKYHPWSCANVQL